MGIIDEQKATGGLAREMTHTHTHDGHAACGCLKRRVCWLPGARVYCACKRDARKVAVLKP